MDTLIVKKSIKINAPAKKVWNTLTDPELIKEWLFGTKAVSDWKIGSSLIFTGNWQGIEYRDKGTILEIEAEKKLKYDYWSSFSGLREAPENFSIVEFNLVKKENQTLLTLTQSNFATPEMCEDSEKNWDVTLDSLKKVVENTNKNVK